MKITKQEWLKLFFFKLGRGGASDLVTADDVKPEFYESLNLKDFLNRLRVYIAKKHIEIEFF